MKVWRASGNDSNLGQVQVWESSEKKVKALFDNNFYGNKPRTVEQIEIPTGRTGLIDWLNQHLSTDNG